MTTALSPKEKQLLQDQKKHEEVCIQKYQKYGTQANDPQLKQLFETLASHEQQHLNTINSILNGQTPSMSQSQQGQQTSSGMQSTTQPGMKTSTSTGKASPSDTMLCQDMLMTEKYVSGAYDTAIFECSNSNIRQALNHIQKEEQQHGEDLFNYMNSNGMYTAQQ